MPRSIPELFRIFTYRRVWTTRCPRQCNDIGLECQRLANFCPQSWDFHRQAVWMWPSKLPNVRFGAFCIRQRLGFYQWKDVDWWCPALDMKQFLFVFFLFVGAKLRNLSETKEGQQKKYIPQLWVYKYSCNKMHMAFKVERYRLSSKLQAHTKRIQKE